MSLESNVKPLGFGVDTIYLNVYANDGDYKPVQKKLDPEFKLQLDAWKELAQEENEPSLTSYVFDSRPLLMQDKGAPDHDQSSPFFECQCQFQDDAASKSEGLL
jgi:hypothetical protein